MYVPPPEVVVAVVLPPDELVRVSSSLVLEVRPDDLAYISIDLIVQGFIQSRGDNTV